MSITDEELAARLLFKLVRRRKWQASHTPRDLLRWGIPKHELGRVGNIVSGLVRRGWLVVKKTGHGEDVFLNFHKRDEILEFVDKNLKR